MKNNKNNHKGSERLLTGQHIHKFMYEFDRNLMSDSDFNETVIIKHSDGSKFHLENALVKEDIIRIYVYTEHCGFFWFPKKDLEEMKRTHLEYNEEKEDFNTIYEAVTKFNSGD